MNKPKLATRAVNAATLLIMFNQEIGTAAKDFQSGTTFNNPEGALGNLLWSATGIQGSQVDINQLRTSITSKVGGFAFGKAAKWALRHFKV
jgi:hypothetical protein